MKQLIAYCTLLLFCTRSAIAQHYTLKSITPTVNASFRGLSVPDGYVAWVSGSKGYVGKSSDGGEHWTFTQVKGYEHCDFRNLYAFDANRAVIANAGTPAYILYTINGGVDWTKVYQNNDSAAFFDGIGFRDGREGIIYGDPIRGRLLVLRTHDGGKSWQEMAEQNRPVMAEGEASFAASGTSIRCMNKRTVVIATGGKVSRLLWSDDNGNSWRSIAAPIIQGLNTMGIFSVAFTNNKNGVIVGGDYKRDTMRSNHIFRTQDGGVTWKAPVQPTRGYRECVEYIDRQTAIATGPTGTDISYDGGKNWTALSDELQYHVVKKSRKGLRIIIAGGNGRIGIIR